MFKVSSSRALSEPGVPEDGSVCSGAGREVVAVSDGDEAAEADQSDDEIHPPVSDVVHSDHPSGLFRGESVEVDLDVLGFDSIRGSGRRCGYDMG